MELWWEGADGAGLAGVPPVSVPMYLSADQFVRPGG
jgi:hypothetical protein